MDEGRALFAARFRKSSVSSNAWSTNFAIVQSDFSKSIAGPDSLSVVAAANEFIHSLGASDILVLRSA
jgi:hypothetical protein